MGAVDPSVEAFNQDIAANAAYLYTPTRGWAVGSPSSVSATCCLS